MKNVLAIPLPENRFMFLLFGELALEEATDLAQDTLCSE
jgi:hypothetical protein